VLVVGKESLGMMAVVTAAEAVPIVAPLPLFTLSVVYWLWKR